MYIYSIIHVPPAHEVKNQRVIVKRTSQIMKYGQDVIIQIRADVFMNKHVKWFAICVLFKINVIAPESERVECLKET